MIKLTIALLAFLILILAGCHTDPPAAKIKPAIKPVVAVVKSQVILRTIDLFPYVGTSPMMVDNLFERLKLIFPKIMLQNPIALPASAYYEPRKRYKADTLISFLSETAPRGHISIGLTNRDISTTNGEIDDWGVIGLSFIPGNACVVSTFRLNKSNLSDQLFKVAIYELGHTQGLDHCVYKTCYMRDAEGKNTTDQEKEFCVKCKAFLTGKGWILE